MSYTRNPAAHWNHRSAPQEPGVGLQGSGGKTRIREEEGLGSGSLTPEHSRERFP